MKALIRVWIVAAAVASVVSPLAPAFADPQRAGPDTETLNRLQARFEGGRRARLSTLEGERIVVAPVFTLEGVRSTAPQADLALVPWSAIERIDARGGRPARGAVIGGLVGLGFGLGMGFALALGDESGNGFQQWMGFTAMSTAAGAIGGAAFGGTILRSGWTQVYPERKSGSAWGLEKRK